MIRDPEPPFFLVVPNELHATVAETIDRVEGSLEYWQVDEGEWVVYEANAHRAVLGVERWRATILGWSEQPEPVELQRLLVGCVTKLREDPREDLPWPEFVDDCAQKLKAAKSPPRTFLSRFRRRT